ncbi:MAG: hypothetical protein ACE5G7_03235 [Candidatus Hydrothermarchaeaceae archaeon]
MAVTYDILKGNSQVKGRIGEVIASHHLREMGLIVDRPSRILSLLKRAGVPDNYEVQFLRRYKKTMDYFAVLPRDDPLVLRRQAICEVFAKGGLDKYTSQGEGKGYVVEVKTSQKGNSRASKRQERMFHTAGKLGFGGILAKVTFKENYTVEIRLVRLDPSSK